MNCSPTKKKKSAQGFLLLLKMDPKVNTKFLLFTHNGHKKVLLKIFYFERGEETLMKSDHFVIRYFKKVRQD